MEVNYFTILYWFCHTSTWIHHRYTCIPHPEPPSHLPPCTIPLGRPSAPAPSIQYHASNLDWRFVSYMILYMFQCHSPKSSHPLPLQQSPKDCSIHLCLFWCLAYRVIITIFWKILNYVKCLLQDHLMIHIESLCIWGIQPSAGYLPGAKQTVGGLWAPQDPHPTAYHRA